MRRILVLAVCAALLVTGACTEVEIPVDEPVSECSAEECNPSAPEPQPAAAVPVYPAACSELSNDEEVSRTFDESGLLRELRLSYDGKLSSRTTYDYLGDKTMVRVSDGAGELLSTAMIAVDDQGRPLRRTEYAADGGQRQLEVWRYDDDNGGAVVEFARTHFIDAQSEYRERRTFVDGSVASEVAETDLGRDGVVNKRTTKTFAGGYLHTEGLDVNGDGVVDTLLTYKYDTFGGLVRVSATHGDDPLPFSESTWVHQYDELGRNVATSYDDGNDGVIDQAEYRIFSAAGILATEEHEIYGAGAMVGEETWQYDDAGNLLRQVSTIEGQTTFTIHDYGCWDGIDL